MISGGREVNFLDSHGNYRKCVPETIFTPRYSVPDDLLGAYVLERWRPAEWYAKQGWGRSSMEFNGAGQGLQVFEPVWPEGGYEAVIRNFEEPMLFPRDVSTWTIQKAIRVVFIQESLTLEEKMLPVWEARRKRKEEQHQNLVDHIDHLIGPMGFATYSAYGGFRA